MEMRLVGPIVHIFTDLAPLRSRNDAVPDDVCAEWLAEQGI